ncbi:DUF4382 domain-containing protein [Adhaeribacter terreus]|uniref:DUF4382 domain-containing protein n=1 Tax=Adhaeribacter terreus TaxID=529703 RepID=A0ABW0ECP5_9BACT
MKKAKFMLPALLLGLTLGFSACDKNDDDKATGTSRMEVRLTDAPGDYDKVLIDIRGVEIHTDANADNNSNGWTTLSNINPGVYNLLDFSNGKDTLLAASNLPAGHISQIRLILGENNTLVLKDGSSHALKTPSGQTSGLKVKIDADLVPDVTYVVLLDFDAAKSIVAKGNGGYNLKPVIRTITEAIAGGIRGNVTPAMADNEIHVIETAPGANGVIDTIGGFTDANGNYLIKGLTGGIYNVDFYAPNQKKTIGGVVVTNNAVTTVNVDMN